ncbi:MAG: helix-turn-helix domain-containing protein [Clostridiales bacterium]|jgi:transcriptional regulator with XRE-family HTH domain|nr:helix-turn-helix domain-containing protein [Clostridiales bacterium]
MTNKSTLSERFNTILSEQKLTKADFAKSIGVSANYIYLVTSGKKESVSRTLAMLTEQLYGYSADWILRGAETCASALERQRNETIKKVESMDENRLRAVKAFIQTMENME